MLYVTSYFGVDEKGGEVKGFRPFSSLAPAVKLALQKFTTTNLNVVVHGRVKEGEMADMMSFIRQPEFVDNVKVLANDIALYTKMRQGLRRSVKRSGFANRNT